MYRFYNRKSPKTPKNDTLIQFFIKVVNFDNNNAL